MFKIHPEFDDDLLEDLAEAADSDGDDEINYEAYVRFVYDNILKLNEKKVSMNLSQIHSKV